jgi:hypothetical protein
MTRRRFKLTRASLGTILLLVALCVLIDAHYGWAILIGVISLAVLPTKRPATKKRGGDIISASPPPVLHIRTWSYGGGELQIDESNFRSICPYCHVTIPGRKPPNRRSSFRCPFCAMQITVDPVQFCYPFCYLTEKQAGYVEFLRKLDNWCFTLGSQEDYERTRDTLQQQRGTKVPVGDIIWNLMNQSLRECGDNYKKELMEWKAGCQDLFDAKTIRESAPKSFDLPIIHDLMKDFRAFEQKMRKPHKSKKGTL